MAVIEDAYRRAARIFSPDISRTYSTSWLQGGQPG